MFERHAFRWQKDERGNQELVVLDVPVMTYNTYEEHANWPTGLTIGDGDFKEMVDCWKASRAKGKVGAHLMLGHNQPEKEAPIIGRLDNVRFERPWLRCDVVIKDEEAQKMALNDQLPNWSAEFYPKANVLWGLSLIQGQEGHHSEEEADFLLGEEVEAEVLAMLKARGAEGVKLLSAKANRPFKLTKDEEDNMGIEEILEELKKMNSRIEELGTRVDGMAGDGTEANADDEQPEKSEDEEGKLAEDEEAEKNNVGPEHVGEIEEKAGLKRANARINKLEVGKLAAEVKAAGCHLPEAEIEKQLSKLKTSEGRREAAERLKALPKPEAGDLAKEGADGGGTQDVKMLRAKLDAGAAKIAKEELSHIKDPAVRLQRGKRIFSERNPKIINDMRIKANGGNAEGLKLI